ncbi:unnamed protein product, partial [Choristocarpus tenellus]
LTIAWLLLDGFTHLGIEAGYVWLALTTTAAKTDSFMAFIWREYARADSRLATTFTTIIMIFL